MLPAPARCRRESILIAPAHSDAKSTVGVALTPEKECKTWPILTSEGLNVLG